MLFCNNNISVKKDFFCVYTYNKYRNLLQVESDIRIQQSNIDSNMFNLVSKKHYKLPHIFN